MRILVTVADLRPESGGPSRTIPALCSALALNQCQVEILSLNHNKTPSMPLIPPPNLVKTSLVPCWSFPGLRLIWAPKFSGALYRRCEKKEISIIHDNGMWLPNNHATSRISKKLKLPLVLSTRGMLEPWSLSHRALKKKVAWWLYQKMDIEKVSVFHVTSEAEVKSLRKLGMQQPIAVIPNGVNMLEVKKKSVIEKKWRTILFVGRIHPIKGLLNLIEAWAAIRPKGWRVIVAGPDENGHRATVEAEIKKKGLQAAFFFTGRVNDEEKWNLYCDADLFVLPSYSESFGVVITEALSCGVPVITTKGTPWKELENYKCGWRVDIDIGALTEALREAIILSDDERRKMGLRGRKLVEEHYSWPKIAKQMLSVYKWILGEGSKPACVRTY